MLSSLCEQCEQSDHYKRRLQGRAVQTARSLEEGHNKVLVPETLDVVFEENNGKLVLLAGSLTVEDALTDPTYGVSIRAVKLRKRVQV